MWGPDIYSVYQRHVYALRRRSEELVNFADSETAWERMGRVVPEEDFSRAMLEIYENVLASDTVSRLVPDVLMAHENMHISQQGLRFASDWKKERPTSRMSGPENPAFYKAMASIETAINRWRRNTEFVVDKSRFNTAGSPAGDYSPYGPLAEGDVGTPTNNLSGYSAYQEVLSRNPDRVDSSVPRRYMRGFSVQEELAELAGLLHGSGKDPAQLREVLRQTRLRRAALRSYYDRLGIDAPEVLGRTPRVLARSMERMSDTASRYQIDLRDTRRNLREMSARLRGR
jgi:hypothetical protein